MRESSSSCGSAGVLGEGDFRPLASPGHPDLGGEPAHPRLGGDVELRIDRRFALEADIAADQVEAPAGEIVGAADQLGVAGDRAARSRCRRPAGSALHSLFMPSPVTVSRLGARTPSASRQGAIRRTTGPRSPSGRLSSRDVEPRHLRRGGGAAELEAALGHARRRPRSCRRRRPSGSRASPVTDAWMSSRSSSRAFCGAEIEAHADAARRGEIERARCPRPCRRPAVRPRNCGDAAAREPPNRPADSRLSITMPVTALSSRAPAVRTEPLISGLLKLPRNVGADRRRAAEIEQFDPGQPPQGVGRAVIADLRPHRRPRQAIAETARARRFGRDPRLRPADRPALARPRPRGSRRCCPAASR